MGNKKNIIVAFSGGKDSTALSFRMSELGHEFRLLYTPTGNELPEMRQHIERVGKMTKKEIIVKKFKSLGQLIEEQKCLPNWRMRWCTRILKIETAAQFMEDHANDIKLAVGLRADEEGRIGGTYDCDVIYPLREWGWSLGDVTDYLALQGIQIPERTDCAVCYYQTLHEWYQLLIKHPDYFRQGEKWEALTGFTFRSAQRDTWPAALKDLRVEFEAGRVPKKRQRKNKCRVCSM